MAKKIIITNAQWWSIGWHFTAVIRSCCKRIPNYAHNSQRARSHNMKWRQMMNETDDKPSVQPFPNQVLTQEFIYLFVWRHSNSSVDHGDNKEITNKAKLTRGWRRNSNNVLRHPVLNTTPLNRHKSSGSDQLTNGFMSQQSRSLNPTHRRAIKEGQGCRPWLGQIQRILFNSIYIVNV